jgi:hypothetical protein
MTTEAETSAGPTPSPPAPTIHEAELASGPSGAVEYAAEIDFAAAVARRMAGSNVVVRGEDVDANRRLASAIESAVGVCIRGDPHPGAGPPALPHYQPQSRPPDGHTFYETSRRKARKAR